MKKYVVLFEKSADGYSAYVPDLPGCVAFGDTREETEELIYEAIKFHIEGLEKNNQVVNPSITDSEVMVFY
ncbi:MAG TPA: type II toxin-antitoxin system HicB family antitoxin [Spirochaetota bacterium]|nr:type II toxin-antitoxin system HicB family antitoxin [Spirochaetota bacterium]HQO39342.1 type II toxin-antitoxin system HicB family antitoxin [Spirochaetota bacterium]